MAKKLNTYFCIVIGLLQSSFLCASQPMPISYETIAPNKESLSFINDSICVHTMSLIGYENHLSVFDDTCHYYIDEKQRIILYKKQGSPSTASITVKDDINRVNLDFLYDIDPKVHNIFRELLWPGQNFTYTAFYVSPPFWCPTFYESYGMAHSVVCDTLYVASNKFLLWKRRPIYAILYPTDSNGGFRFSSHPHNRKVDRDMYRNWTNSYEYLNYHINMQKKDSVSNTSLCNTVFSYTIDSCNIEELMFINDSLCVHSLLSRPRHSSAACIRDTLRYELHNHLITLRHNALPAQNPPRTAKVEKDSLHSRTQDSTDIVPYCFTRDMNGDILAYKNGFLFYSKVYKAPQNSRTQMALVVKPFMDERLCLSNKTDSINAIMEAYFAIYVPLNYFSE